MSIGDGVRRLAASLVIAGRQRLELVALDLEEELLRAGGAIAAMLVISSFATVAFILLAAAIAVALWDRAGIASLLVLGTLFAIGAVAIAWRLGRAVHARPAFLAATLHELDQDGQALRSTS